MMKKALFLDRDGVINVEKDYVYKIEDFEFLEGVFEALLHAQKRGYLLVIITNQAGIGRGYYTVQDFEKLNKWMLNEFQKQGIKIDAVYYSPFHPTHGIGQYKKESELRKPNPGMILKAKEELKIDLGQSILVGDKESDIEAGKRAGIAMTVLVKSGHKVNQARTRADYIIDSIKDLHNLDFGVK